MKAIVATRAHELWVFPNYRRPILVIACTMIWRFEHITRVHMDSKWVRIKVCSLLLSVVKYLHLRHWQRQWFQRPVYCFFDTDTKATAICLETFLNSHHREIKCFPFHGSYLARNPTHHFSSPRTHGSLWKSVIQNMKYLALQKCFCKRQKDQFQERFSLVS